MKSDKAHSRESVRAMVEQIRHHETMAKFYFNYRHSFPGHSTHNWNYYYSQFRFHRKLLKTFKRLLVRSAERLVNQYKK